MPSTQPDTTALTTLVAIRAAHHAEATLQYDRVVFEFSGPTPLLRVEYVAKLIADGSGLPVAMTGHAILCVQFDSAQAHGVDGHATAPDHLKPALPIVKEIRSAGDFEGVVTYGIGAGKKTETRVLTLAGPNRLVIDFIQP